MYTARVSPRRPAAAPGDESLPPKAKELVAWLLDKTFDARLGADLKDWEEWLRKSPESK